MNPSVLSATTRKRTLTHYANHESGLRSVNPLCSSGDWVTPFYQLPQVKQSLRKHPITTSQGRGAICIPVLAGEHYKKTTLQRISEIIPVDTRICD
jgi:hypothetical protein